MLLVHADTLSFIVQFTFTLNTTAALSALKTNKNFLLWFWSLWGGQVAVLNLVIVTLQSIFETNNGEIFESKKKMIGTLSYSDLKTRKHNFYKLLIMR